ncbi:alpha/beta hydrolase family protein [Aquimarina sp. W85]|uniref:alpha/beta hydrolase family protein n=1 Tax=Aquimarina rhodophyticola TaxID=3342246 RepID=UPI00366F3064
MKIIKNSIVTGKFSKPLLTDIFFEETTFAKPVILFCHGYKGFKDWGPWDLVAKFFAKKGYCFIKFNFSHNGCTVEQPDYFDDLQSFGENTYSKEMSDVDSLLDWIYGKQNPYIKHMDLSKVSIIGHSRGGGIATLVAAIDSRIRTLITWAGVSNFKDRFPKEKALSDWKKSGVMYVTNKRTLQEMPHYYSFYTDFLQNEKNLTIEIAAKKINIPTLIIHGELDTAVTYKEAKNLKTWIPHSTLITIEEANHVFGAQHPYCQKKLPSQLLKAVEESINFAFL